MLLNYEKSYTRNQKHRFQENLQRILKNNIFLCKLFVRTLKRYQIYFQMNESKNKVFKNV